MLSMFLDENRTMPISFEIPEESEQDYAWETGVTYKSKGDFVLHNNELYFSIQEHIADTDNEPGLGVDWDNYWVVATNDDIKQAVPEGYDLENTISLYIASTDEEKMYANISVEKFEEPEEGEKEVTVEYSIDNGDTWSGSINLEDGAYRDSENDIKEILRRVTVTNILEAFYRNDIRHKMQVDEFIDPDQE